AHASRRWARLRLSSGLGQRRGSRHQTRRREPGDLHKFASIRLPGHDPLPKLVVVTLVLLNRDFYVGFAELWERWKRGVLHAGLDRPAEKFAKSRPMTHLAVMEEERPQKLPATLG